jgi:hypothetical protein
MHRGRPKQDPVVSAEDLVTLQRWTSRPKTARTLAMRSQIILDGAAGMTNTAIVKQLNQIAGLFNPQAQRLGLRRRFPFRLGCLAGDQAQALNASARAVPAQDLEHTAGGDHDAAPHRQGELGCNATRA